MVSRQNELKVIREWLRTQNEEPYSAKILSQS